MPDFSQTNKNELQRVVVLGSKSFIATSIVKKLNQKNVKTLEISRDEIDFSKKDDCIKLDHIIQDGDSICFVAAKAPVKDYQMLIYNIQICQNICDIISKIKISHLFYVSSDAVYKDCDSKLTETSCAEPDSLHGLMHITREKILESFFKNLCIVRPTLIYGDDDPHNGYGPNKFLRNAKNNFDIDLFGQGEELRDHVWIGDVAEISARLIFDKYVGKINITSGLVISFLEIANLIKKQINPLIKINYFKRVGPMPHNGYRAFENNKLNLIYKDFKYKLLKDWISDK